MIKRPAFVLLTVTLLGTACRQSKPVYTETVYFTSFDTVRFGDTSCLSSLGKRHIYSFTQYNADSQAIYEVNYAEGDPRHATNCHGWSDKPIDIRSTNYKDGQPLSITREFYQTQFVDHPRWRKVKYTYIYENSRSTKYLLEGKPLEEYTYDSRGNITELREYDDEKIWKRTVYTYDTSNKELRSTHYANGHLVSSDTTFYDSHHKSIKQSSFDSLGRATGDILITRDSNGHRTLQTWYDEDYGGNAQMKYYWDSTGRIARREYYIDKQLKLIFENKISKP